jgi:hypothetical protein
MPDVQGAQHRPGDMRPVWVRDRSLGEDQGRSRIMNNKEVTEMEKVAVVGIKKDPAYLYFVDRDGDISRAKLMHGGRPKKGGN